MAERYDLVIIGAGPAGYVAAEESASKGKRTALIENRELGGTCLNRGCIPTKTLLHSAELFGQIKACGRLGIHVEQAEIRMDEVQARKEEVIGQLRSGIASLMKKNKVTVYEGTGTVLNRHTVLLHTVSEDGDNKTILETEKILLATGSVPAALPIPGADLPDVTDSDALLDRKEIYPSLTIVGGGVIGMEFASIYSALGCQVTVIEYLDRILANMDKEISQSLKMIMKKRGVEICTGARVEEIVQADGGRLICRYMEKEEKKETVSDGILIAAGRRANISGLFADVSAEEKLTDEEAANRLGIRIERGRIVVDENGQTDVPGIYAAGDVTGGVQLAHAASAQAVNAVAHMWGEQPVFDTSLIPGCVYTDPEIATVGLTQEEAKKQGLRVISKKYPMSANAKTVLTGQERGFIRVTADADTQKILGAQIMCARATDMISELADAIKNGLTLQQMAGVVRPHPTFAEAIGEAVKI